MKGNVLILGATSAMGRALAEGFAARGAGLALASRRPGELERLASDLSIRFGVQARTYRFDALDFASHPLFLGEVLEDLSDLEGAVLVFGYMGVEEQSWKDPEAARRVIDSNLTGAVSILVPLADYFEKRGEGFLCAVSSVAGDRGRKKNMTYGAAKAGLSVYMQGLFQRMAPTKVKVVLVKPGFVDTPMTFPLGRLPFLVSPEKAAAHILKAVEKGKPQVYTPWIWRWIMLAIRMVPNFLFKKMKF